MELKEVIKQLNELYHKSKESTLTPAELEERERLRRIYLGAIRGQVKATLERVEIVEEPDSNDQRGENHTCHEHCGCGHKH